MRHYQVAFRPNTVVRQNAAGGLHGGRAAIGIHFINIQAPIVLLQVVFDR